MNSSLITIDWISQITGMIIPMCMCMLMCMCSIMHSKTMLRERETVHFPD